MFESGLVAKSELLPEVLEEVQVWKHTHLSVTLPVHNTTYSSLTY